jgi:glycosyltransferase involved in cell wall biosynthesis
MAFGIPCVGSRVGAIPTIIDDGVTGLLVNSESAEELSWALDEILEDESRARALGRNGRGKVESELTWAAVVGRMLDSISPRLEKSN